METASKIHSSSLTIKSIKPMTDLTALRLRPLNQIYHHHRRLILNPLSSIKALSSLPSSSIMADSSTQKKENTSEGQNRKQKLHELPPPPEKPEPGDCCGSGCVRCVWDVYYEELEAYNQLVNQFNSQPLDLSPSISNSNSNSKHS